VAAGINGATRVCRVRAIGAERGTRNADADADADAAAAAAVAAAAGRTNVQTETQLRTCFSFGTVSSSMVALMTATYRSCVLRVRGLGGRMRKPT